MLVFTLNLVGSERYFSYLLIGLGNNFGFGFTSLNPKAPHFKRVFFLASDSQLERRLLSSRITMRAKSAINCPHQSLLK